ncbi:hypothetical protein BGZ83_007454 [Gryganskiella cystojenkinii]|nr:hypothetical protein BGZ83_007454 [Gryganskiella cystojenkinii]
MSTNTVSRPQPPQQPTSYFTKRKPAKAPASSLTNTNNGEIKSTSMLTPPVRTHSMATMTGPRVADSSSAITGGMAMGSGKSFEESQNDLFAKLEALAASKNPAPKGSPNGGRTVNINNNKLIAPNYSSTNIHSGSSGQYPFQQQLKQTRYSMTNASSNTYSGNRSTNSTYHGSTSSINASSYTAPKAPEKPREPRRRINSAQFKTPSAADMTELAQVVVANATPPKVQNKLRKRASTLSLTASTFLPPGSQNPSIIAMTPTGGMMVHNSHQHHSHNDFDYRHQFEAAVKESKNWEKKYSSAQNQIHYEREKWEERYSALERAYKELEMNKTEANLEKMNSLLDTVQQLQVSNEIFRKQLQDAGIEPDSAPAARFHSHLLLVGENLDRTFLEENEVLKEKSLVTNQKITSLSTEISNAAIAISQTINYVQLRYLTQMLDAAEHVSSQKRSRAMSNSFLSDMLSRGVKKTGSSGGAVKSTNTIATQTHVSSVLTALQQQQLQQGSLLHQNFGGSCTSFRPLETKLTKSFSFSSSLLNLAGLSLGGSSNQDEVEIMYRLKGGAMDDRSQMLSRQGIPPVIVQDLKGSPGSPESIDKITANRKAAPQPKFQYASPTTSQLRIFVPDVNPHAFGQMTASSVASGSRAGSVHSGGMNSASVEGPLRPRRSSSDISLMMTDQQQQYQQQQVAGLSPKVEHIGGKYPYPHVHASRPSSQKSMTTTSSSLHRSMSQQFLSPEMAFLYSKQ